LVRETKPGEKVVDLDVDLDLERGGRRDYWGHSQFHTTLPQGGRYTRSIGPLPRTWQAILGVAAARVPHLGLWFHSQDSAREAASLSRDRRGVSRCQLVTRN
jgi:hypothetical protein